MENRPPIHITVITYTYSACKKDTCARLMRNRLKERATYVLEGRRIEALEVMFVTVICRPPRPPYFLFFARSHMVADIITEHVLLLGSAEGSGLVRGGWGIVKEQRLRG